MLEHITAERAELYRQVPPPGESTPIETDPFVISESITSMEDIEWSVRRLRHHSLGGRRLT